MNHTETLRLWRRCIRHALENFGVEMPDKLRLWFAEQLMHDGSPITCGNRHARELCDMSEGHPTYDLTPDYEGEIWVEGLSMYSRSYNIT